MILLAISFLAGILTVLAPCVLPLLPVIVGGSLAGAGVQKRKALTIVIALGLSVIVFTFLLKVSTLFITIPEFTWKLISGSIVIALGLVTVFPKFWDNKIIQRISARSNALVGKGSLKKSFWGDVLIGAALGPVFSTCSPTYFIILATVLPVSLVTGVLYLLAYVVGLCGALFGIAYAGQKITSRLGYVADANGWFKRGLGVLFIIVGLAVLTGFDKQIQTQIIGAGFFDVTTIEQKLLQNNEPQIDEQTSSTESVQNPNASSTKKGLSIAEKERKYKRVPEISTPDGFINTNGQPITLASLRGKVVLLDIWTYSCINCQRTIPYLNGWYSKYKDQGLEIVGLHTPEFAFEKVQSNVEAAVQKFGIKYPVVLDNDYSTWLALGNQFWPRKYLIDEDGFIIYDHIGEGGYDDTEKAIRSALAARAAGSGGTTISGGMSQPKNVTVVDGEKVNSPETYFGASRNKYLANGTPGVTGIQNMVIPKKIVSNQLYLGGSWNFTDEFSESTAAGAIVFNYDAKNVYMAAGATNGMDIKIFRDDVLVKTVSVQGEQLYQLIDGTDYGRHNLRIEVPKAGLKAFTFTFG